MIPLPAAPKLAAFELPQYVAAAMQGQLDGALRVCDLVFDLVAGDELPARRAFAVKSVARLDDLGNYPWQRAIVNLLADSGPQALLV